MSSIFNFEYVKKVWISGVLGVNSYINQGADYACHITKCPPRFSDLPMALKSITTQVCKAASARDNDYGEN